MSGLLALIGWVLLQGELAWVMAERGVFPAWFSKTAPNGTPIRAHLASTSILTGLLIANSNKSIVGLFTFALLLSTTGCLFAYLLTALAALRLQARRDLDASPILATTSMLAASYSIWAIWGAGREAAFWGSVALLAGFPIYAGMRGSRRWFGTIRVTAGEP
jgi:APA family basic amino acid/polyamine antiporter